MVLSSVYQPSLPLTGGKMKEPTKEEIKEFWELCGLVEESTGSWYTNSIPAVYAYYELITPGDPLFIYYLFKYAVPKLYEILDMEEILFYKKDGRECVGIGHWIPEPDHQGTKVMDMIEGIGSDSALALFWALWEVKER